MNTDNNQTHLWQQPLLPALLGITGFVLMILLILTESEAGGLPVLMTIAGGIWYAVVRYMNREVE